MNLFLAGEQRGTSSDLRLLIEILVCLSFVLVWHLGATLLTPRSVSCGMLLFIFAYSDRNYALQSMTKDNIFLQEMRT